MENTTRTLSGAYLQTCAYMKLPFELKANTTLNEKFGIQAEVTLDIGTVPSMRYFSIGIGGHTFSVGANGVTKNDIVQHRATDAALYKHLPFVLRAMNNDIDVTERAKYGLRRIESHNGAQYIAYYLKRIDFTNVEAGVEYTSIENDVSTVVDYVPSAANLNPTPPTLSPTGVNLVTGDYVSATAKLTLTFSKSEIQEIRDACMIIYGDDNYAIISEIALCSGVDKVVTSPSINNGSINFNEVIGVQITAFANTLVPAKFSTDGAEIALDVGSCEPLLNLA